MRTPPDLDCLSLDGLRPARPGGLESGPWLVTWQGRSFRLALERARVAGPEELEARFARGVLRVEALERDRRSYPHRLVVIRAPSLSRPAWTRLREFATRIAEPGVGGRLEWVVTDGSRILGTQERFHDAGKSGARRAPSKGGGRSESGFSDAFLVMTKVLAHTQIEEDLRPPRLRNPPIRSAAELAAASGVSVAHAFRFVELYQRLGFLERRGERFVLRRFDELSRQWATRLANDRRRALPYSYAEATREDWLSTHAEAFEERGAGTAESASGGVLGLHEAAARWGFPEVVGAGLLVHCTGAPDPLADRLDLIPSSEREADVWLLPTRFLRSVRAGASHRGNPPLPVVDLVHAYLDALATPARGQETARRLREPLQALFEEEDS